MSPLESSANNADGDRLAATLSSLCLLHCLLLPMALALIPSVASSSLTGLHGHEWIHWALIAIAIPFSLSALRKGLLLHGQSAPALAALAGFSMVIAGAILHGIGPIEQVLTLSGGLVVAAAHWRNWRLREAA